MIPIQIRYILIALCLNFIWSCNEVNSVAAADENELITRVQLNFNDGQRTQTFVYNDPDGDGGKAPIRYDAIKLEANKLYTLTIEMYDDSKVPSIDATAEIYNLKEEHLFVYTPIPTGLFNYIYGDSDANSFPIGLTGTLKTYGASVGQIKVQLRHQPAINGVATKNGSAMPGSDDLNIFFNLEIVT